MVNKLPNPGQVVLGILFDVVVPCQLNKVGLKGLSDYILPESLAMTDMHDLIPLAMDDVHWTIEVLYPIDVWKLVDWQSPSEIAEDNP